MFHLFIMVENFLQVLLGIIPLGFGVIFVVFFKIYLVLPSSNVSKFPQHT